MRNPDRTQAFDNNAVADALFGPDGGMAIWVRREEVEGRACVRRGGDLVQACMDIAAIHRATDALTDSLARMYEVDPKTMRDMVHAARTEMDAKMDFHHVTRIKPTG